MFVKITNLKNNREFAANFDTQEEAENWVRNHKHKGADEKIMYAPTELDGAKVLGKQETPMGTTYKLQFPAEYKVEYFDYDVSSVNAHWQDFKKARLKILKDTDYTQLPDVPINTETRGHYRKYREYVRNKKNDYKDENIHTWKILSFEEYKQMKFPK
jgi:hypothetical protein